VLTVSMSSTDGGVPGGTWVWSPRVGWRMGVAREEAGWRGLDLVWPRGGGDRGSEWAGRGAGRARETGASSSGEVESRRVLVCAAARTEAAARCRGQIWRMGCREMVGQKACRPRVKVEGGRLGAGRAISKDAGVVNVLSSKSVRVLVHMRTRRSKAPSRGGRSAGIGG
jgi:hypothetical protein